MFFFLLEDLWKYTNPTYIFYGGGWIDGSKKNFFNSRSYPNFYFPDYAFVAINYRLFDFYEQCKPIPTQEMTCDKTINYIKNKTNEMECLRSNYLSWRKRWRTFGITSMGTSIKPMVILKAVYCIFSSNDLPSLYRLSNLTDCNWGLKELTRWSPQDKPNAYLIPVRAAYIRSAVVPTIIFPMGPQTPWYQYGKVIFYRTQLKRSILLNMNTSGLINQGMVLPTKPYSQAFKDAADFLQEKFENKKNPTKRVTKIRLFWSPVEWAHRFDGFHYFPEGCRP